ncbi:EscI/YscI/HrpB family type III secretion system inner rod protein [Pseudomonas sp. S1_E04]
MRIETFQASENNRFESGYKTREQTASTADAGFFTSMVEQQAPTQALSSSSSSRTTLSETAQQLKLTENNLVRLLKSSRKGTDMEEFTEYPRELSKAVLTSQLLTKCLGKTTQCIDKLSNLQ